MWFTSLLLFWRNFERPQAAHPPKVHRRNRTSGKDFELSRFPTTRTAVESLSSGLQPHQLQHLQLDPCTEASTLRRTYMLRFVHRVPQDRFVQVYQNSSTAPVHLQEPRMAWDLDFSIANGMASSFAARKSPDMLMDPDEREKLLELVVRSHGPSAVNVST